MLPPTGTSELAPLLPKTYKSPRAAALLGIIPGLGHTYLGDYKTAGTLFGSAAAFYGGAAAAGNFSGSNQFENLTSLIVAQNISSYSMFAAYRDARLYNGEGGGYRYQMPTDSFADLAAAPFKLSVLKKPEVWGGLLGALSFAAILDNFLMPNDAHIKCSVSTTTFPLSAFSVGIGEEALFRGYLQSYFAESMSPTAAIINSSILCGAAHIGNAARLEAKDQWRYYAFGLPFITAFGGYFGWLTHKNRSLKESVAIHSWYDFILFSGMAFAGPSAMAGKPEFAFAFTF